MCTIRILLHYYATLRYTTLGRASVRIRSGSHTTPSLPASCPTSQPLRHTSGMFYNLFVFKVYYVSVILLL